MALKARCKNSNLAVSRFLLIPQHIFCSLLYFVSFIVFRTLLSNCSTYDEMEIVFTHNSKRPLTHFNLIYIFISKSVYVCTLSAILFRFLLNLWGSFSFHPSYRTDSAIHHTLATAFLECMRCVFLFRTTNSLQSCHIVSHTDNWCSSIFTGEHTIVPIFFSFGLCCWLLALWRSLLQVSYLAFGAYFIHSLLIFYSVFIHSLLFY